MTDGQNEARDDELTKDQRRSLKIIDKNYRGVNRQNASRMERISDAEMVMQGLSDRLGNCYGGFTRDDIEKIVVALVKWLGKTPDGDALIRHAGWIYDHVYSSVDIDSDEGGEYIGVGCCLSELFEDLTKLLAPIILKAYHDREDLLNMIDNGRTILSPVQFTSIDIRTQERTDCVAKIVEWLKR